MTTEYEPGLAGSMQLNDSAEREGVAEVIRSLSDAMCEDFGGLDLKGKSPVEYLGLLMGRMAEIEAQLKATQATQERIEKMQARIDNRLGILEAREGLS